MKYLIFLLLLSSCASMQKARTYKAYQRVAADPFVDEREGVLLSQKCIQTYPVMWDTPRVYITGVDSAEYEATLKGFEDFLNQFIHDEEDSVRSFDGRGYEFPLFTEESAKVIKKKIKEKAAQIKPIVKSTVTQLPYRTTVNEEALERQLRNCKAELASMTFQKEATEEKLQKRKTRTGWMIAGGLALSIIAYFGGKISKKRLIV